MPVLPRLGTLSFSLAALILVSEHALTAGQERVRLQTQGGMMLPPPRDAVPAPQEPPIGTAVIEGAVVSADLGRPVRRATVRLAPVTAGPPRSTTTDDGGRFRFEAVAAGQYLLSASKPGYLDSTFGQRQPGSGRPGTPISVAGRQRVERISLPIARGGVLAGTVSDDGGEPAFGTEVQAYRFDWSQGERTPRFAGSDTADDRGSFRIGALPPGEYLVVATPAGQTGTFDEMGILPKLGNARAVSIGRMAQTAFDQSPASSSGYAPVFYPGTTSSASAMHVTIGVSEERAGLDVQLPLVPMGRVEGVIMTAAGPSPGTEVRLIDLDMPVQGLGLKSTATGPDGRFSFDGVPPGRYRVQARSGPIMHVMMDNSGGGQRVTMQFAAVRAEPAVGGQMAFPPPPRENDTRWAAAEITFAGGRLDPLTLMLQPGVSVSGRMIFDGADQPPSDLSSFRVMLNGVRTEDGISSALAHVTADGRFTIAGVTPGTYRVDVFAPPGWRAKSFTIGGRDALDSLLDVTPNQQIDAAELTMTSRASMLSGTLSDSAGRPAAGNTIIVFPDDPSYWTPGSRRIRAVRPSTDGRYAVSNLPAGNYRLVAVDDLEEGQWFDPNVLKQLSGAALPISIGDGEAKVQDLRVAG